MSIRPDLEPFVQAHPWLKDLGDEMLARLDASDWYHLDDPAVAARRRELEDNLEVHVMAYRREAEGLLDALARLVEPAELTDAQLETLRQVEAATAACVFVAFKRPLRHRPGPEPRARRGQRRAT